MDTKEIQIVEESTKAIIESTDYKTVAVEWLTSMGLNLKENHKKQFIDVCCAYGLNPIKKEVYGVPYGDKFNIIVGYESYIKRAERSGLLSGWKVETVGTGNDMKAVITINRKDWNAPFVHEVDFSEYNTNQNLWKTKPKTMIKKVAIAQGFRMCFSETLGGMPYTADELPDEMSTPSPNVKDINSSTTVSVKSPKTKEKKYTDEQKNKLAQLMNAILDDGTPVFNDAEKDSYRAMLIDGLFDDAYASALDLLKQREQMPSDADIESELN
ncbi:MAG: phage recombination protein Bet [archaeon]|nr:phage recombination protein Bet [archaeon]